VLVEIVRSGLLSQAAARSPVSDVTLVPHANGAAADAAELAFALPPGARGAAGLSPRLHEGDVHVLSQESGSGLKRDPTSLPR
jgi:hypothetical protein